MLSQWRNIQKNKLVYYEEQYVSENNRKNLCLTELMRFTRRRSLGLMPNRGGKAAAIWHKQNIIRNIINKKRGVQYASRGTTTGDIRPRRPVISDASMDSGYNPRDPSGTRRGSLPMRVRLRQR